MDEANPVLAHPHEIEMSELALSSNPYAEAQRDSRASGLIARQARDLGNLKVSYGWRLLITGIAIGFLWITTFNLSTQVVAGILRSTKLQTVTESWTQTFEETTGVKTSFLRAVASKASTCQNALESAKSDELNARAKVYRKNAELTDAAIGETFTCQSQYTELLKAISTRFEEQSSLIPNTPYSSDCSQEELATILLNQINKSSVVVGETESTMDAYFSSIDQTVLVWEEEIENRSNYDTNYLLAYQQMLAKALSENRPDLTNIRTDYVTTNLDKVTLPDFTAAKTAMLQQVADAEKAAMVRYNDLQNELALQEFQLQQATQDLEKVKNKLDDYKVRGLLVINTLNDVSSVSDGVPPSIDIPEFNPLDLKLDVTFPSVDVTLPTIDTDFLTGQIDNLASGQAQMLADNWNNVKRRTQDVSTGYASTLADTVEQAFDKTGCKEYDVCPTSALDSFNLPNNDSVFPPIEVRGADQQEFVDNYTSQLIGFVNQIDALQNTILGNITGNNTNITETILNGLDSLSRPDLQYLLPGGTFPDFDNIMDKINQIVKWLILLDVLYRVYRSTSLFFRYWFQSAVGLPIVDITSFKATKKRTNAYIFAQILTNPLTIFVVLFGLGIVLAFGVSQFVVPMFRSYAAGCVDDSSSNNFALDSFAIAYNYVSGDGLLEIQAQSKRFDIGRTEMCNELIATTTTEKDILWKAMVDAQEAFLVNADDFSAMHRCIDIVALLPQSTDWLNSIAVAQCRDPFYLQQDQYLNWESSVFNCSSESLPQCDYSEVEPDTVRLRTMTKRSACASQQYALMKITEVGIATMTYICWNLGRVLIMMGVSRLCWKKLTPQGFNYTGSCTREGEIVHKTRRQLQVKLALALRQFIQVGWVYLVSGIILPIVPIIIVVVVKDYYFDDLE